MYGYEQITLLNDWSHENWGYYEYRAELWIAEEDGMEREDKIYFYAETKKGIPGGHGRAYSEERNSNGAMFTLREFKTLIEQFDPEKSWQYLTCGDLYNPVPYVAIEVKDGMIKGLRVRNVSCPAHGDIARFIEKVKSAMKD